MLAAGLLVGVGAPTYAQGDDLSIGVYRIPYEDKTQVRITNDHASHRPPGRLDMVGQNKKRIVVAAGGVVRFIVDEFDVRQGARAATCNNNYVWIEHPNGEWTKYSHMEKGSVRRAKINVGDEVQTGTYLGDEGDVGCATGSHLHFEVAVPRDPANPINPQGGFIRGTNRVPRICDVSGHVLVRGNTYRAAPCRN